MPARVLISLVFLLLTAQTSFADYAQLSTLFRQVFATSHYQRNQCGTNIMRFVELAGAHSANRANILRITSKGFAHLEGMVAYKARNSGRLIVPGRPLPFEGPDHISVRHPGEAMWYFHIVLEYEGNIFDFDFTNEPLPTKVAKYFEEMFYPKTGRKGHAADPGFPEVVKDDYEIQIIPAAHYLHFAQNGGRPLDIDYPKVVLREYLKTESIREFNPSHAVATAGGITRAPLPNIDGAR